MIPLHASVQPTRPVELTAEDRARYLGSYRLIPQPAGLPGEVTLVVFEAGNRLRARATPALFGHDAELDLVAAGDRRFHPGWYLAGRFFDAETDMAFSFTLEAGRASSLEFRGLAENLLFARGERVRPQ